MKGSSTLVVGVKNITWYPLFGIEVCFVSACDLIKTLPLSLEDTCMSCSLNATMWVVSFETAVEIVWKLKQKHLIQVELRTKSGEAVCSNRGAMILVGCIDIVILISPTQQRLGKTPSPHKLVRGCNQPSQPIVTTHRSQLLLCRASLEVISNEARSTS